MNTTESTPASEAHGDALPGNHEDFFLQTLVDVVNQTADGGLSFGITLQVGGLLVTGNLISGDRYFERFAESFAGAFAEGGEGIRKTFAGFGDQYKEQRASGKPSDGVTTFIHLENCRFGDASALSTYATLWRGKIAEVDGFFLGSLSKS